MTDGDRLKSLSEKYELLLQREKRLSMFLNQKSISSKRMVHEIKLLEQKLELALSALDYYHSMSGDNGLAGKVMEKLKQ